MLFNVSPASIGRMSCLGASEKGKGPEKSLVLVENAKSPDFRVDILSDQLEK